MAQLLTFQNRPAIPSTATGKATWATPVDRACVMRVVNHVQVLAALSPASLQYLEALAADLCHRAELPWRNDRRGKSVETRTSTLSTPPADLAPHDVRDHLQTLERLARTRPRVAKAILALTKNLARPRPPAA